MSVTLYCARCAWMNEWEAFLLKSKTFVDPAFSICVWLIILASAFHLYQDVHAKSAAVQKLQKDVVELKRSLDESVELLGGYIDTTMNATATAIKNMHLMHDTSLNELKTELIAGPLALELTQTKLATTDSLQSLRARILYLEQELEGQANTLNGTKEILKPMAESLDRVMAWGKKGDVRGVYDAHWVLLSRPDW